MSAQHPLQQIEDRKGQTDLGVIAFRVYDGARQEGASRVDAMYTLAGWLMGTLREQKDEDAG